MIPTPPGMLPNAPAVTPIARLSPSQHAVLTACVLRASWTAAREPALLPTSPAARLGSAIHALLEEAGRGHLDADAWAIGAAWNRLVADIEGRMAVSWLERSLVPLRTSIRDYEVRRIRAERKAAALASEALRQSVTGPVRGTIATGAAAAVEMWVAARDGSVGGYIDGVRETPVGVVLLDYKSGAISEKGAGNVVKESYQTQLKLYAALYAETFGRWPVGLEIVPLEGAAQAVAVVPDECQSLLKEASAALTRANEAIVRAAGAARRVRGEEMLTNPDPAVCRTCPYRPVCAAYHRAQAGGTEWPADVRGHVAAIQTLGNGRVGLTIATDAGLPTRIRSLSRTDDRHPALNRLQPGDNVSAYNLDRWRDPRILTETPLTVLYREPDGRTP